MSVAVDFKNVDIIFGKDIPRDAEHGRCGRQSRSKSWPRPGPCWAAAGVSLTVNEGEISVLMGLSGSGKSTLLRAVNGLNKVSRGIVLVKDGDQHGRCRFLRRRIPCAISARSRLPWCFSSSHCCRGEPCARMLGFGLELAGVPDAELQGARRPAAQARRP